MLKPLLPLMTSEQNVPSNKCPFVCMECSDIILEAQLEAKFQFTHPTEEKRTTTAKQKIVSLDKPASPSRAKDLEQKLHEAQQEIRQLKKELEESRRRSNSTLLDVQNKNLVTRSKSLADLQL